MEESIKNHYSHPGIYKTSRHGARQIFVIILERSNVIKCQLCAKHCLNRSDRDYVHTGLRTRCRRDRGRPAGSLRRTHGAGRTG